MNNGIKIPFFDLKRQTNSLREELEATLKEVVESGAFILGKWVENFERLAAEFVGVRHAVGVASGTDALTLSYQALGAGRGDGLITSPFTFFATAGSMLRLGIRPFFVDIDPKTYNIAPDRLEEFLFKECRRDGKTCFHPATGTRIKGVVPVHIFGRTADMSAVNGIAGRYGLFVVEDAAQALGASVVENGAKRMAGSFGASAAFSFYPTKNLGSFGDGGMITTDDAVLAEKAKLLRNHGQGEDGLVRETGYCSRLDGIQAAILSVKLPKLKGWNDRRSELAGIYRDLISSKPWGERVKLPASPKDGGHIWHQFVVGAPDRDELEAHMRKQGIGVNVYYRAPIHKHPLMCSLGYGAASLPEVEKAAGEALALPVWPELTDAEAKAVVNALDLFYDKKIGSR